MTAYPGGGPAIGNAPPRPAQDPKSRITEIRCLLYAARIAFLRRIVCRLLVRCGCGGRESVDCGPMAGRRLWHRMVVPECGADAGSDARWRR